MYHDTQVIQGVFFFTLGYKFLGIFYKAIVVILVFVQVAEISFGVDARVSKYFVILTFGLHISKTIANNFVNADAHYSSTRFSLSNI
jgi:hypothetical protein